MMIIARTDARAAAGGSLDAAIERLAAYRDADAHTGYGDAIHITRAVSEFEAAGVAAIHVEDQVFAKQAAYHKGRKHVVSIEEMLGRIDAVRGATAPTR